MCAFSAVAGPSGAGILARLAHLLSGIEIMTDSACPTGYDTNLYDTVRSARDGDREAFGRLVERYQAAVCGVAYRRLRNHAESQEVCQDVFVQAMRKIGQLHDPSCFGGWLRSIADRIAINRLARRRPVEPAGSPSFDAACVERETPLKVALRRERSDQVRQGLSRLRKLDRQTLTAFYFDGRSLAEMSAAFESPVGTIKRRLHVARKRLARELEGMTVG